MRPVELAEPHVSFGCCSCASWSAEESNNLEKFPRSPEESSCLSRKLSVTSPHTFGAQAAKTSTGHVTGYETPSVRDATLDIHCDRDMPGELRRELSAIAGAFLPIILSGRLALKTSIAPLPKLSLTLYPAPRKSRSSRLSPSRSRRPRSTSSSSRRTTRRSSRPSRPRGRSRRFEE